MTHDGIIDASIAHQLLYSILVRYISGSLVDRQICKCVLAQMTVAVIEHGVKMVEKIQAF